ncbi:MAG: hypothetical protein GY856_30765 [bacterium]|nr:hypothetical protein [bacterium]
MPPPAPRRLSQGRRRLSPHQGCGQSPGRAQGSGRRSVHAPQAYGAEKIPSHVRVAELNDPNRFSRLADALSRRGYKVVEIEKIIGGNFVRFFREVCG